MPIEIEKADVEYIPENSGGVGAGFAQRRGQQARAEPLERSRNAACAMSRRNATRVAFLGTRDLWEGLVGQHVQDIARTLGITLIYVEHAPDSYTDAFALITRERPDALFLASSAANDVNRQRIADFALQQRLPTIFNNRDPVRAGALMSYGVSLTDLFRRAAGLVDKILKGANPADIPIERPTKFELVINLKTAGALGYEPVRNIQFEGNECCAGRCKSASPAFINRRAKM
jgi:putative ABC transport system substrate-binding protein